MSLPTPPLLRRGSSHGESRIIRKTYVQPHFTSMMTHAYRMWAEAQQEAKTTVYTRTGGLDWGRRDSPALQSLLSACRRDELSLRPPQEGNPPTGPGSAAPHPTFSSADGFGCGVDRLTLGPQAARRPA